MKVLISVIIVITAILITSCSAIRFNKAVEKNSIETFEKFLQKYPDSKRSGDAKIILLDLEEERDWNHALEAQTMYSFGQFIEDYPNSEHIPVAEAYLKELQEKWDWKSLRDSQSISSYQKFINNYPTSSHISEAKKQLHLLNEAAHWDMIKNSNLAANYRDYLEKFPVGKHSDLAVSKLNEIEKIKPAWEKVKGSNDLFQINNFIVKYGHTEYGEFAKSKLQLLESQKWQAVTITNSIKAYNSYLSDFPNGIHSEQAKKKIIDLELDEIFKGDYGKLPSMQQTNFENYSTNQIQIFNNTKFTLTVWYSGPESYKLVLSPKQKKNFKLDKGKYRIAASVSDKSINNYAGTQTLNGGDFEVQYYITTTNR